MAGSYEDRDGKIWLDGQLVEWRDAQVHILTHAMHYASSVFEGERCYEGKIFKSREHSERLIKSGQLIDFEIPYTVDFEYEGEMTVDVALNAQAQAQYPFSRLSGPANILVVPARHSASISGKLMQEMAGATVIGPILSGVDKSIQICPSVAKATDILNMAVLAACKVG